MTKEVVINILKVENGCYQTDEKVSNFHADYLLLLAEVKNVINNQILILQSTSVLSLWMIELFLYLKIVQCIVDPLLTTFEKELLHKIIASYEVGQEIVWVIRIIMLIVLIVLWLMFRLYITLFIVRKISQLEVFFLNTKKCDQILKRALE